MEKIDFAAAKKGLPFDRGELARRIANTPTNIILEYIDGMQRLKGNIEQFISVLSAADGHVVKGCYLRYQMNALTILSSSQIT